MKGCYAVLIYLDKKSDMKVGSLGITRFPKGHYLYIGSAMNGIEQRLGRHLRKQKKFHWHIDYFLKKGEISEIYCLESVKKLECYLAKRFADKFEGVKKFGSTDCTCRRHLFKGEPEKLASCAFENGMREFEL